MPQKHSSVGWCQRIRNETVRQHLFVCVKGTSIGDCIHHKKLRWLGHVLRMHDHRLPKKALFALPDSDWWKPRGGQSTTWQKGMKSVTKSLGSVGVSRLSGWGPRDPPNAWLKTLQDIAANRSQWRMCCQFLCSSSD